jgi:hypothetical protein
LRSPIFVLPAGASYDSRPILHQIYVVKNTDRKLAARKNAASASGENAKADPSKLERFQIEITHNLRA